MLSLFDERQRAQYHDLQFMESAVVDSHQPICCRKFCRFIIRWKKTDSQSRYPAKTPEGNEPVS